MWLPAESPTGIGMRTVAPEVRTQGLGAADHRSDVYSLCACLTGLFQGREDEASRRAAEALAKGLAEEPEERSTLEDLEASLSELLGESVPPPAPPPARFWTEEQVVRFRDRDYRIVARLGSGGVGTTFKVVEIDRSTKEDLGTYVAKVGHNAETGRRVLKAYSLARSHLGRHAGTFRDLRGGAGMARKRLHRADDLDRRRAASRVHRRLPASG